MIKRIIVGDITSQANTDDIIIGMNTRLQDVRGIGKDFVRNLASVTDIDLGSVLTFQFDRRRKLHMLVCHFLGTGGWENAHRHVRMGMDYLLQLGGDRTYSMVQIGTGRVGGRDGANVPEINTAIATSYLEVDLYVFDPEHQPAVQFDALPLEPLVAWAPTRGQLQMAN